MRSISGRRLFVFAAPPTICNYFSGQLCFSPFISTFCTALKNQSVPSSVSSPAAKLCHEPHTHNIHNMEQYPEYIPTKTLLNTVVDSVQASMWVRDVTCRTDCDVLSEEFFLVLVYRLR